MFNTIKQYSQIFAAVILMNLVIPGIFYARAVLANSDNAANTSDSAIALLGALLGLIIAGATITAYIVRLTNSINKMKFDLHTDNARVEANLIKGIYQNEEKILELRHLIYTNYSNNANAIELLKKDIEISYRELSQSLINTTRKITDLESFEAKNSGYNPRVRTQDEE